MAKGEMQIMNQFLSNLNRVEFVITMACTGHCKHCSEGEHVSGGEHINGDIAARAIYEICDNYNIESIMTFGGEPLLYPEVVATIHFAAKKRGISVRSIITNGFFSKDAERINEVAKMLADAGVNHVLLSVDAFHQETIPIEYVKEFAEAIVKEGIPIKAHPAWLVGAEAENPYNLQTREILSEFRLLGIQASKGNIIFPSGNAKKYLSEYFDKNTEYVSQYEEDPKDVWAVSFSPNGDVLNGNINRNRIMDIINAYSANG